MHVTCIFPLQEKQAAQFFPIFSRVVLEMRMGRVVVVLLCSSGEAGKRWVGLNKCNPLSFSIIHFPFLDLFLVPCRQEIKKMKTKYGIQCL